MDAKQLGIWRTQLEIILDEARSFRGQNLILFKKNDVEYLYYLDSINILIEQINKIAPKLEELLKKEGIDIEIPKLNPFKAKLEDIREEKILFSVEPTLLKIIFASSNILSAIRQDVVLTDFAQNKLESITNEIQSIKEQISEESYVNLIDSKETFEKSCFLGSSLISGRLIRACLDQIPGKDIEQKIESLKKLNLIRDKDGKPSLIKANHFGRNLASHDLSITPSASEAISFLAEALKIVKITTEYSRIKSTDKERSENTAV